MPAIREFSLARCWRICAAFLAPICTVLAPLSTCAQGLKISVLMEHRSVLQYEPVNVFVTIRNESEKVLYIEGGLAGEETGFHVHAKKVGSDEWREKLAAGSPVRSLWIGPDEEETVLIELSRWYDLREIGRYLVSVSVDFEGVTYWSGQASIEVVPGLELAKAVRSVPGYPERVRTFSLRYWTRERREDLFLSVTETPGDLNCGVFCLGPVVRVRPPTVEVDRQGLVHVTHQVGDDCYSHTFFASERDGVRFVEQSFRRANGEPYTAPSPPPVKPMSPMPQAPRTPKRGK